MELLSIILILIFETHLVFLGLTLHIQTLF